MTQVCYIPNRVATMNRDFDSIFDSFFNSPSVRSLNSRTFVPKVDISEDKDNLMMVVEVPGMEKDDVKVVVEDGVLTVSGERKNIIENKDSNCIRCELSSGSFARSFTLPDNIDLEKIMADYKNGMLTLILPKTEKSKAKEIKVAVK
jgi:HSP20 family protein